MRDIEKDITLVIQSMINKSVIIIGLKHTRKYKCIYCGSVHCIAGDIEHEPYCPMSIIRNCLKGQFSNSDIVLLTKSMIGKSSEFKYFEGYEWYKCIYCGDIAYDIENMKHEPFCPVLIAKNTLNTLRR